MNLYLLEQDQNRGYDTYDSCVVAAEDKEEARHFHPADYKNDSDWWDDNWCRHEDWAHPDDVEVTLIGMTLFSNDGKEVRKGVVCSSFNAG